MASLIIVFCLFLSLFSMYERKVVTMCRRAKKWGTRDLTAAALPPNSTKYHHREREEEKEDLAESASVCGVIA